MIPRVVTSPRTARYNQEPVSAFIRGEKERHLRIIIDDASLGDDLAADMIRGFVGHRLLDVDTTQPTADPHLVVQEPMGDDGFVLTLGSKTEGNALVRNVIGMREAASEFVTSPEAVESLTRQMTLVAYGRLQGADAIVTGRAELIEMGEEDGYFDDANIRTPRDALALIGLYLRLRQDFAYLHDGRSSSSFGKRGYYAIISRDLLPQSVRWLRHLPPGEPFKSAPHNLAVIVSTRVERALYARDKIHEHILLPQSYESHDEVLFYLEALLFALSGAFDALGRVAHAALAIPGDATGVNWRSKPGKAGAWMSELAARDPNLAALMARETPQRDVLEIIFTLRNYIHGEGLTTVPSILSPDGLKVEHLLVLPDRYATEILAEMDRLGGRTSWGVQQIGQRSWAAALPNLVELVLTNALAAIDVLMTATPVEGMTTTPLREDSFDFVPLADAARARIRLLMGLG